MANEVVQFGDIARAGHHISVDGDWRVPDVADRRRDDEKMGSIEEVFECPPPPQVLISSPSKWSHWRERVNEVWDEEVPK